MAGDDAHDIQVWVAALSTQAFLPQKAHPTDAGFDLAIPVDTALAPQAYATIDLEFAMQIPPGWYGQIFGRSSVFRRGLTVHPGVIDADYRGRIQLLVSNQLPTAHTLQRGDRLAQLLILPVPKVSLTEVSPDALHPTRLGAATVGWAVPAGRRWSDNRV